MLFNSLGFIFVFLPISLFSFYLISKTKKLKLSMLVLVFCSLVFYGWWKLSYLFLLLISIGINYYLGYLLNHQLTDKFQRKLTLILGIIFNLGLIGYYKYANFFIDNINYITNQSFTFSKIILPLGISFFTFQQIAYLVDAYQGQEKEDDLISYSLFVTFFPQLIAGPIVRHREIIYQFQNKSILNFNQENLDIGLTIFILGLFKKVIIADGIAPFADQVFQASSNGSPLTFLSAWIGALAYTFQLYFDFSGYSEMAIGVARMFGIKLPINFNSPYKAIDIRDFWRRWHITLSNFLRDYLYIPLGGNKHGIIKSFSNLIVTMLLGGLWHGAGWTFILWGGLHGLYLSFNRGFNLLLKSLDLKSAEISWWDKITGRLITFFFVIIAWVPFRSNNLSDTLSMWTKMFGLHGITFKTHINNNLLEFENSILPSPQISLLLLCMFVWFFPNIIDLMGNYSLTPKENISKSSNVLNNGIIKIFQLKWHPNKPVGILIGILFFISVKMIVNAPESEFLYFNF